VQASGRGVRHKDDWCVTYLLDKQIERLVVDNQALFPRYWMEAVDYA
jgi:Rad3-related DNA helicase